MLMSGERRACQLLYNFFNLAQKTSASSFTASAILYRRPAGMLRTAKAGARCGRRAGRADGSAGAACAYSDIQAGWESAFKGPMLSCFNAPAEPPGPQVEHLSEILYALPHA